MSKPRTEADLSAQLEHDRVWRMRELSDLRSAIRSSDSVGQRVLLRALVTICYAHFEGCVRFSARKFLEHVALRRFTYDDLDRQYLRNYFLPRLGRAAVGGMSLTERCNLVDEILDSGGKQFSKSNEELVDTKSNLNFEVFTDICRVCGIPPSRYSEDQSFIDIFLLKRRNSIAHGEEVLVDRDDMDKLTDGTSKLMRGFAYDLENIVATRSYRVA